MLLVGKAKVRSGVPTKEEALQRYDIEDETSQNHRHTSTTTPSSPHQVHHHVTLVAVQQRCTPTAPSSPSQIAPNRPPRNIPDHHRASLTQKNTDIIELKYLSGYSVVLFRCKWFDTANSRSFKKNHGTYIDISREAYVDQPYILATQAKQVFYLQDPSRANGNWRVVEYIHHRNIWDHPSMSVVNEIDVVHDTQSSGYNLDARSINGIHNTEPCNLYIDLGPLPMQTSEGGASSSSVGLIDEEDDDEDLCFSDEEDILNDDDDDDDRDVQISSDDSD
ncbi:hypothetical protein SSX86_010412 [Deinandra increscens subsp. villosa]|uniref:DUF4216 domain-containing protein n=1 Tax=Deinandra increscens subsp. villosa TaxID=3103831 RepID=A0AAP0DF77_9ASTR